MQPNQKTSSFKSLTDDSDAALNVLNVVGL